MTALVETRVVCTGAKTCGVTECEHYHEHEWTPACEGGCFDGGVCVEERGRPKLQTLTEIMETRAQKIKINERRYSNEAILKRALELTAGRAG